MIAFPILEFRVPWILTPSVYAACLVWTLFLSNPAMIALAFIGVTTIFIADLASMFGCSLEMSPSMCAITFVALGTSLPDTFASKTAAQAEPYADASIGNVTGSNAVNVFLGLGLPWLIAAAYWDSEKANEDWLAKYGPDNIYGNDDMTIDYPGGGFIVMVSTRTQADCARPVLFLC